jgi:branched-subunit amino acid aminotransferase/4-amino-4-deoxychorismate lyase
MKEAFLTSSTKGVMPVIEIEDIVIGDGTVGEMTLDLHQSFNHHLTEHIALAVSRPASTR